MPFLQLDITDLSHRGTLVQSLLAPISKVTTGPAWKSASQKTYGFIIAAHGGSTDSASYLDWRFATFVPDYRAMYHEHWNRSEEDPNKWYLFRAYLHILRFDRDTRTEEEIILLHCDPTEADDVSKPDKPKYKRMPHVHMHGGARYPFSKAHIALTVGYYDAVLESTETLTEALRAAIQMVKMEILEPLTPIQGMSAS